MLFVAGLVSLAALFVPEATYSRTADIDRPEQPPKSVLQAPVALLVDMTSGQVLHAQNATRRFMPASVTKTMTAYVAFELMKEGKLSREQEFTISPEAFEQWEGEGSTMWLDDETPVSVHDLLRGILTVSANDASVVLAEGYAGSVKGWTDLMNQKARELEMTGSHFGTPNGWPDEGSTFTTAQDLVKLARALIRDHPQEFARYFGKPKLTWNEREQVNHDPMIGRVEGADGLKTGYTREAGFSFLGTAKRGDQRLVLVLAGTKNPAERAQMARDLTEWGFATFDRKKFLDKGAVVGTARVQGGDQRQIELVTDREVYANIRKQRSTEYSATIEYDGPVRAPFKAGDRVATLVIDVPDMEPARVPLVAREDVGEAGFFDRLINGFAGWFS